MINAAKVIGSKVTLTLPHNNSNMPWVYLLDQGHARFIEARYPTWLLQFGRWWRTVSLGPS
jgi:hypothetical protein